MVMSVADLEDRITSESTSPHTWAGERSRSLYSTQPPSHNASISKLQCHMCLVKEEQLLCFHRAH